MSNIVTQNERNYIHLGLFTPTPEQRNRLNTQKDRLIDMLKELWNYNNPEQKVKLLVENRFSTELSLEPLDPNAVAANFRQRAATR